MTSKLFCICVLVIFLAPISPIVAGETKLPHVVFIAGSQSHGYGEHETNAGGEILVADLNRSGVVTASLYKDGWPKAGIEEKVAVIVLYMDGDSGHPVLAHMDEVKRLMARGVGLFAMHFAVHVPPEQAGDAFTNWLGGYYDSETSTNPHWRGDFKPLAGNSIFNGVKPFSAEDEFYFNIKLQNSGVKPVLVAVPPNKARLHIPHPRRILGLFGGSVPEAVANNPGRQETIAWSLERADGGRGFGFTGGHFHWNWANEDYRRFVLNAIVWTAKGVVPSGGIEVLPLTIEDLKQGQDESVPLGFDEVKVKRKFQTRTND